MKDKYIEYLRKVIKRAGKDCTSLTWFYGDLASEFPNDAISWKEYKSECELIMTKQLEDSYDLKNKKCFISIPITGVEDKARNDIKNAISYLSKSFPTCIFISPFEVAPKKDMPDSYYMGKDVEKLMESDIIIQMPNWENSKGCRVENFIADTYNIAKISYDNLLIK